MSRWPVSEIPRMSLVVLRDRLVHRIHAHSTTVISASNPACILQMNDLELLRILQIDDDLLSSVTFPHGAQENVGYTSTTGTGMPFPYNLVASTTLSDGEGNSLEKDYTYTNGYYYYGGVFDQRLAGFNTITERNLTDSNTNIFSINTFYHQGDTSDTTNGEYQDDEAKIGKPYRIEVYNNQGYANNDGALQKVTINKWDDSTLANNRQFVKLATTTTLEFDNLGGAHKDYGGLFQLRQHDRQCHWPCLLG
jgi:hypothetical protein